jgi:hypothetical protein
MGHVKEEAIERGTVYPVANEQSLAKEAWPDGDPVMVGQFIHFGGEYPTNEHPHTCKTYWRIPVHGNDDIGAGQNIRFKAWRPYMTKAGELIHCQADWHDRILDFCRDIERVWLHYWQLDALAYLVVPDEDRKATAAKIRKHNQRLGAGEPKITYTTFPLKSGGAIFLHDDPDYLGGDELPTDREELFDLVTTWAMPPKGKRSGHGLGSWAKNGAKVTPEDVPEKTEEENGKSGKESGGQQPKVKGYIYGQERWTVFKLISESLEVDCNPKRQTVTPGFKSWDLVELLEAAQIDYGIEGDVLTKPPVTEPDPEPAPLNL